MSITARVFRTLVRLLPATVSPRDADALAAVYDDLDAESRARAGALGGLLTLVAELPGLTRLVARERVAAHRLRRSGQRSRRLRASYQRPYSEDTTMIESLLQDVRYAARALRKSRAFAMISVATLALGIGANTAIFSVVHGVLLAPLPFAEPDRIVTVMSADGTGIPNVYGSSPANFNDVRQGVQSASQVAAFSTQLVTLVGQGEPESLQSVATVGDIFGVLGVRPLLGRTLMPNDDAPSSQTAAVLTYRAWQQYFGGDQGVIGKTITLGRKPVVVVGVLRPDFKFAPAPADIWVPEQWKPDFAANRDQYYLQIVARLRAGRSVAQASAELEAVAARLRQDHGEYNTDLHLSATSLRETVVSPVRARLFVLMGAVGFLLLITCANLANLALARASSRHGEFAVRRALGAGYGRIVRQLLTESVLLATLGGVAGVLVGAGLLRLIVASEQATLPRVDEIGLDPTTLAFTTLIALVAGIAVGVLPALRVSASSSMEVLRQGTRGSGINQRARSTLVVAELAIALMLLSGAGLLLRSFAQLLAVNTGFATEHLLTMQLNVGSKASQNVEQSLERIRALPGVRAASVTSQLPVTGRGSGAWLNIVGRPTPPNQTPPAEAYRVIAPDYFSTMGIRLVRGRFPTLDDRVDHGPAVIVNAALAKKYWPNDNPIGKQVQLGAPGNYLNPPSEVVGIVDNTPDAGLDSPPLPMVYLPHRVAPWWSSFTYVVRTSPPPEALTPAVRRELRALFPTTAIRNVQTMDAVLHDSVAPARLSMRLIGAFAIVALITAALGVFGVLSFVVAQRTRELGIRMALGAAPQDVRRMVIGYGSRLAVAGLAIGLAGSFALTRLISTMLFGVKPTDPVTFGAVSVILLSIGVLASWIPARRATRIDPIAALRSD
ncbi:MAG TPA: ABC transporter permease [Gemmatimonadaceae bacterium]|nr:ABC transporter permease [Gemmatimonadaceae bacterium]